MRFVSKIECSSPSLQKGTESQPHIYNPELKEKYVLLTKLYDEDSFVKDNYDKISRFLHPFEYINSTITSSFIPNCPDLKITNAFMKMWEFIKFIDSQNGIKSQNDGKSQLQSLFKNNKLDMFDIAGAPGMFILATERYLKTYHPSIELDWYTCSLEGGTALTDSYNLFKNNPKRYTPCDVLIEKDLKTIIDKYPNKFSLVVGDIGIYHDDDWNVLQEERQLDIEWGQMILMLNLIKKGGCSYLKMYSLITKENVYLLDVLSKYFENVFICKPFTSRLLNNESYIVCLNRNDKKIDEPLKRPYINKDYTSNNIPLITSFENARLDKKYQMFSFMCRLLKKYNNVSFKDMFKNKFFRLYVADIYKLFNELKALK